MFVQKCISQGALKGFLHVLLFSLAISLVLWYKLVTLQIWSQTPDNFWNLSSFSESPQIIWFYCDTDCDSLNSRVAQVFILSNIDNMEYVILASLTETLKIFNKLCCWFKLKYSLLLSTHWHQWIVSLIKDKRGKYIVEDFPNSFECIGLVVSLGE